MAKDWYSFEVGRKILTEHKRWAIVGCSAKTWRPSYGVAQFLIATGYDVVCINPNESECLVGVPCYPNLKTAAEERDIEVVDVFRRADAAGAHVDEAIEIGAKAVWMQLGVVDEAAAARADEAGLAIVMDRCPKIDLPRVR